MYRRSGLSGVTSLDEIMNENNAPNSKYISSIIKLMNETFINKESVPPIFLFEKEGSINPVKIPNKLLDSDEGKEELAILIQTAVETFKPESFCLITEAWIYKIEDCDNPEEAHQIIQNYKKGIQDPKLVREESITFSYSELNSDNSHSRWLGSMPIHRDSNEIITKFGPVKWVKAEGNKNLVGRFAF